MSGSRATKKAEPPNGKRRRLTTPIVENVEAVAKLETAALRDRSWADRVGDAIAHAVGSVPFAVSHVAWFAVWVLLNSRVLHGIEPFDPYPFNFLTLVVSLEAIFLSVFVLMSQNRLTRLSEVRAHLDLQVNLLAERELTTMLELQHAMCEKLGITVAKHRVRELLEDTDVQQLTKTLERNLPKA